MHTNPMNYHTSNYKDVWHNSQCWLNVRFLQWPLASDENTKTKLLWWESVSEQPRPGVANISSNQKQIFIESNLHIWGGCSQHWCFQLSMCMLTDLMRYLLVCILHRHTILSLYMAIWSDTVSTMYISRCCLGLIWYILFINITINASTLCSPKEWKCFMKLHVSVYFL
jgi:hypothetical protein